MIEEIWKDVDNYEGIYQISNLGRVKSLSRHINGVFMPDRILSPRSNGCGYVRVNLFKADGGKPFSIHRLVAQAFIPNPNNKEFVNHKNGVKTDNRVENLEWVTHIENMEHARKMGFRLGRPRKGIF